MSSLAMTINSPWTCFFKKLFPHFAKCGHSLPFPQRALKLSLHSWCCRSHQWMTIAHCWFTLDFFFCTKCDSGSSFSGPGPDSSHHYCLLRSLWAMKTAKVKRFLYLRRAPSPIEASALPPLLPLSMQCHRHKNIGNELTGVHAASWA